MYFVVLWHYNNIVGYHTFRSFISVYLSHLVSVPSSTMDNGVEGTDLVLWAGGPPGCFLVFYLTEAFQSQTNT